MTPSSRISSILKSVSHFRNREVGSGETVRAHGATRSAQALLLARWATESKESPLVVLCPNEDVASQLAADIQALSETVLGQPIDTWRFPTWDQSVFSSIAPSIRTRFERVATLSVIQEVSPKCGVIITTIEASCQTTLSRERYRRYSLNVQKEGSVESRDVFARNLLEAGYLRVDPVEDPGTFAVRGEIIDVFPLDRETPIRIELFGDEVERIREFDAATQRTTQGDGLNEVCIPPAREVLINTETIPLLRERLKQRADDLGVSRSARDPILNAIQDGMYPDHSDAWAPFAYAESATLWDWIPRDWPVIWADELAMVQNWDEFAAEQKKKEAESPASGLILPKFEELFQWNRGLERAVRARTLLQLDRIELTDAGALASETTPQEDEASSGDEEIISRRHRLSITSNSDLTTAPRQSIAELEPKLALWRKQGFKTLVLASTRSQLERIRFILEERGFACLLDGLPQASQITLSVGSLSEGFRWPAEGLVVLNESEILGTRHSSKQKKGRGRGQAKSKASSGSAAKDWSGLQALSDLGIGDAVVHVDHGIGRYQGIVRLDLSGAPADFLLLEYANKDKLYLPVYRLNVIQKYVGAGEGAQLDRLGTLQFTRAKEKVKEAVKKLAFDLVQLYAERKVRPGTPLSPRDSLFREFEAKFPFDETPDQLKAIDDTLTDLESGRVMDRLVCGDVGYGKTEVAMRAAFRAVSDGKQVAVLVPTTVLAHQHEQNFRARMKDYPISIESVSRFKSAKEQKDTLAAVSAGKVDIVVGTHRLLSKDVRFGDLGLIIVDEEHRFGVEHKERLKTLKVNTHVLTLTATPIPRTLHMALSGLRDISLIQTPPVDRLPIRTFVSRYDESLIKQAIETELNRGGQVFFVHNRVQTIFEEANRIRELVPSARIAVGHGQMAEGELEKAMLEFYQKRANVLVCTSIIESGLDLPSANTILVNRADAFGLAALYQIRGRVGRGQARAYAYLLLPSEGMITEDAKRRLEVIQKFVELGSGFSIANHDLEIRGGGDLLGPQQSGHIAAVGFDLYTELLDEAIRELEGKPVAPEDSNQEPEIKAPFPAFLSEEYIPDVHQRLSLYRRFSAARQESELVDLEEELRDRFGNLPNEAQNLMWLIRIKQQLKQIGVNVLTVGPERISLTPGPNSRLDPVRAIALVSGHPGRYQLTPDSKFVAKVKAGSLRDLHFSLEGLLQDLLPRSANK